jgi:hypothetical protein
VAVDYSLPPLREGFNFCSSFAKPRSGFALESGRFVPDSRRPMRHKRCTDHGQAPEDPLNYWNNVTAEIGGSDMDTLSNLVNTANLPTGIGLLMVNRFNGSNGNGTQDPAPYPREATRDSLFGNTEVFSTETTVPGVHRFYRLNTSL